MSVASGIRTATGLAVLLFSFGSVAETVLIEAEGLRMEKGFKVQRVADDPLVPDASAMTLDGHGRPVVAGAGYIKRLEDRDADGQYETAEILARTRGSAMGLNFEGHDLLAVVDGGLWRYRDTNADGKPDGAPTQLMPLRMGEHGAHAIRKGPDGAWYLLGGNEAGFSTLPALHTSSWVRNPVAGALLRLGRDFQRVTVEAHGFRNPYDFDFLEQGAVMTWDSDCERDFALPWYVPTRVYTLAWGQHHGWQLGGHERTWARPSYEEDAVQPLYWMGRGSPTGVAAYRHRLFSEAYRNGVFALDWTFGKVWFCPSDGSEARVFLEPAGANGFAPTDVEVTPDGSLLISIGGRRTRGGIYRIQPERSESAPGVQSHPPATLDEILSAPQPLEAWSRRGWEPAARRLGAAEFVRAVEESKRDARAKIRAIEILADVFEGREVEVFRKVAVDLETPPSVRARAVWALGFNENTSVLDTLTHAFADPSVEVRRTACESAARLLGAGLAASPALLQKWTALVNDVKGVRRAARLVSSRLSNDAWTSTAKPPLQATSGTHVALAWAALERGDTNIAQAVQAALTCLEDQRSRADHGRALRLLIRSWGDWNLAKPSVELFTAYEFPGGVPQDSAARARAGRAAVRILEQAPSGHDNAREAARLLAMIMDDQEAAPRAVLARLTPRSTPQDDFHFLTALARLRGSWPSNGISQAVSAMLGMDRKWQGISQRPKQVWSSRLRELAAQFAAKHPSFSTELLNHADFPRPAHVDLVRVSFPRIREARLAARAFFDAAKTDPAFPWTPPLVEMLSILPPSDAFPLLRSRWNDPVVGEEIFQTLAIRPHDEDRARFVSKLSSTHLATLKLAVEALSRCSTASEPATLLPLLRLLKRSQTEPELVALRPRVALAAQRQSGQAFGWDGVREASGQPAALYQPIFDWFETAFPGAWKAWEQQQAAPRANWNERLRELPKHVGNASRGSKIFQERACAACHEGASSIGPPLAGATRRLSMEAMLESLFEPDRVVAPAYQTYWVKPRRGDPVLGQVAFESADGVILIEGPGKTRRIDQSDMESKTPSSKSLMPSGLLDGLSASDLADLLAYLASLEP